MMKHQVVTQMFGWKQFVPLAVAAGLILGVSQAQAELLIELKFNETGTTAANTGVMSDFELLAWGGDYGVGNGVPTDLHSADGLGVSGLAGDRAFDNTASELRSVTGITNPIWSGGVAHLNEDPPDDGFSSYTISGWFKTATGASWGEQPDPNRPDGHAEATYLFHHRASSSKEVTLYNSKDWGTNEAANKTATSAGTVHSGSGGDVWTAVDEWVFFAMTFDATTSTATFYAGGPGSAVSQVGQDVNDGLDRSAGALNSAGPFTWGADRNMLAAFKGYMDNVRLHDEALDLAGLEALRAIDVIPEPASLGLLALGATLCSLRRRR